MEYQHPALREPKKFICKHCKVEVISKSDFRPVMLKQHKSSCPRRILNWR